jgi:hypothetical protein
MSEDYKFWMVVHPSKFLPIMIVVLAALVVIVHAAVVSSPKYNWISGPAAAAPK